MGEFVWGALGAGVGYMIASLGDRFATWSAGGNTYNTGLLAQPIWSQWQRIVAAGVSIAVPLGIAAAVGSPGGKTFFQLAGFGAVARTVGKAGDDTIGMIANSQGGTNTQNTLVQLYAPEVSADQALGLSGLPRSLGAIPRRARLPILGSLPIIGPLFGGRTRVSIARKMLAARAAAYTQQPVRRLGQSSSAFAQGASNAQALLSSGATTDPTVAGIAGYFQAVGAYNSSTAQLISAATAAANAGYYAADQNGNCASGDTIINAGEGVMLCQKNPAPPAPPPTMTPPGGSPGGSPPGGMPPSVTPPMMSPPPSGSGSPPIPPPANCPPCSPQVTVNPMPPPPSAPVTPPTTSTPSWMFPCPDDCEQGSDQAAQ